MPGLFFAGCPVLSVWTGTGSCVHPGPVLVNEKAAVMTRLGDSECRPYGRDRREHSQHPGCPWVAEKCGRQRGQDRCGNGDITGGCPPFLMFLQDLLGRLREFSQQFLILPSRPSGGNCTQTACHKQCGCQSGEVPFWKECGDDSDRRTEQEEDDGEMNYRGVQRTWDRYHRRLQLILVYSSLLLRQEGHFFAGNSVSVIPQTLQT